MKGRHPLEQLGATPENADACRAAQLVRGEGEEVAAECRDVDAPVRSSLRRVDDHDRALLVRPGGERLDRVDRPQRVRDEGGRDDLDAALLFDHFERIELQLAAAVDGDRAELRAGTLCDLLPGNEVRVVLELGRDNDVAGIETVEPPGVGDKVQRLGRAAREDNLARGSGVDEGAYLLARALEALGRQLGEQVDAAVDVCVRGLVELAQRVEHLPRLLRAHRGVEVGERLAVEAMLEDREVRAELARVELGLCCDRRRHGLRP